MSDNIVDELVISNNLSISVANARQCEKNLEDEDEDWENVAECNFLSRLFKAAGESEGGENLPFKDEYFSWGGERSGRTLDTLTDILSYTTGKAEVVYTFESGYRIGYVIDNGSVREKKVKVSLE